MHWHITSTTYGTWLPGDERGFVSCVREYRSDDDPLAKDRRVRLRHNQRQTDYDQAMPGLKQSAQALLKCPPINLTKPQAEQALEQFLETCGYRHWVLLSASVMSNHFHAVVQSPAEVDGYDLMGDLKGYASRRLNRLWGKPASGTWWTESGSPRPKTTEAAVCNAVRYAWNQEGYLCRYIAEEAKHYLDESERVT